MFLYASKSNLFFANVDIVNTVLNNVIIRFKNANVNVILTSPVSSVGISNNFSKFAINPTKNIKIISP